MVPLFGLASLIYSAFYLLGPFFFKITSAFQPITIPRNATDIDTTFITAIPAALRPPEPPAWPLIAAALNPSTHYPIPHSTPPFSLILYTTTTPSPIPYPTLAPLLISCLTYAATSINKPLKDITLPKGLFACSDDEYGSHPLTYLTFRAVAQAPPVTGREMYRYLITVLRGLNEWARGRGGLDGGVILVRGKEAASWVFVAELGFVPEGMVFGGGVGVDVVEG